jgi:hypothetical protein
MLNLLKWMRIADLRVVARPSAPQVDLQIRSLLDDPNLRRAMGLDGEPELTADEQDADEHDADRSDAIRLDAVRVA